MTRFLSIVTGPVTAARHWFGNRSIGVKFNTIAAVYALLALIFLMIIAVALDMNRGLRGYIHAEGLWSKGQKDAVYYLVRYIDSGSENDFRNYLQSIAIPLADREARLELQKPEFDYAVAERSLLKGGVLPEDIPPMIRLFRRFNHVSHMKKAIALWTEGDANIAQLTALARDIRSGITSESATAAQRAEWDERIHRINTTIAPLASEFSTSLSEAAVWLRALFLKAMGAFVLMMLLGGSIIVMISRRVLHDLKTLRLGTQRVAEGDLSVEIPVGSEDEVGMLTRDFNAMILHRRGAEAAITQHRRFEWLMMQLSTGMVSLAPGQLDDGINRALSEIGRFAEVDRAYIFVFSPCGSDVSCTHEWCDDGIDPQITRLQALSVSVFPWVEARLLKGEVVHVPRVDELPLEASAERAEWRAELIQSLLLVPMMQNMRVIGYVGFDSVRAEKSWSEESIALLRIFSEMVSSALQRKLAEALIQQLAHHDVLTKLPNRALLMDRMEMALERARRSNSQVAVLMIDLDHFKNINDSLGHAVGDQVLLAVAERLSRCARKTDTVSRMGGDEYVIVLTEVQDRATVDRIARTILDEVEAPIHIGTHELTVTPSIGISTFPNDGQDSMNLLKNADTAMYQAKAQGRGNHQWFTPTMLLAADERLDLENALRKALDRNEFSLYYQPLVAVNSGQVVGMEALIRWQHPRRGLLLPGKFINLAEETGLIVPIGSWVLRRACQEGRRLQDRLQKPLIISVNISTRQFRHDNLLQELKDALSESGLPPSTLVLEITESVLAANAQETTAVLEQIRALGVRIAVDDFGTGYSSLSYITNFPIDMLKIDASFVRDLTRDEGDAAITSAIIALAHSLKLEVIAEGVETPEQLAFLQERSCNEVQGLYLGGPVPSSEFADLANRIDMTEAFAGPGRAPYYAGLVG